MHRRPNKDEKDEELSPCPFCSEMLPITDLDCPSCKNSIPYCIVTGGHMTLDNWSYCPSCRFPALHSKFGQYLERNAGKHLAATTAVSTQQQSSPTCNPRHTHTACPMCDQAVISSAVTKADNAADLLKAMTSRSGGDEEEEAGEGEGAAGAGAGAGAGASGPQ